MDLDRIRELIIGFALISLIAAAGAIALSDFQSNEKLKDTSSTSNESVTLTAVTADVVNESNTLVANVTTLSNNYLTTLTELRNVTGTDILGFCNITLSTGLIKCNETYSATIYADYTYNSYSTGELSQSALFASASACRNSTMTAITLGTNCNVTGTVTGEYDYFVDDLAYIDYTFYTPTHLMNITDNGLIALDNTTSYFGTAGTIAGVALLLTIVIGAFYFVTREAGKGT